MSQFLNDNDKLIGFKKFYSCEKGRQTVLHARTLVRKMERFKYLKENISEVAGNDIYKMFCDHVHIKAVALSLHVQAEILDIEYHDRASGLCTLVLESLDHSIPLLQGPWIKPTSIMIMQ